MLWSSAMCGMDIANDGARPLHMGQSAPLDLRAGWFGMDSRGGVFKEAWLAAMGCRENFPGSVGATTRRWRRNVDWRVFMTKAWKMDHRLGRKGSAQYKG